jgi:hypothetical protein
MLRESIEERHAQRLADGWRFAGWCLYYDADEDPLVYGADIFFSNPPGEYRPKALKRAAFSHFAHTGEALGYDDVKPSDEDKADVDDGVQVVRDAFAHRDCGPCCRHEISVRRWLLTRCYRRVVER